MDFNYNLFLNTLFNSTGTDIIPGWMYFNGFSSSENSYYTINPQEDSRGKLLLGSKFQVNFSP